MDLPAALTIGQAVTLVRDFNGMPMGTLGKVVDIIHGPFVQTLPSKLSVAGLPDPNRKPRIVDGCYEAEFRDAKGALLGCHTIRDSDVTHG